MLLERLQIESFRAITTPVVLDGLAPVNLIFGENNSGKTSALEAAALLLRPNDPPQWVQLARNRDLDMILQDGLWSFFPSAVSLYVDDGPKTTGEISILGLLGAETRRLTAQASTSISFETTEAEKSPVALDPRPSGISARLTLSVKTRINLGAEHEMIFGHGLLAERGSAGEPLRCFTVAPMTHRSTRAMVKLISNAVDEGRKRFAVELLQLFAPQVLDLDNSLTRGREGIRVSHAQRGVVDLASFGDGMRRAAALALALSSAQSGVLLIDELEAGIHPSILPTVVASLVRAAKETGVQILATSHSLEAFDALLEACKNTATDLKLFHLQREGSAHVVRSYDKAKLIEFRELGLDLR